MQAALVALLVLSRLPSAALLIKTFKFYYYADYWH